MLVWALGLSCEAPRYCVLIDAGRKDKVREGRLGNGKRLFQRTGVAQRKMVKLWSHVGQFLVSFQLARQNVWFGG